MDSGFEFQFRLEELGVMEKSPQAGFQGVSRMISPEKEVSAPHGNPTMVHQVAKENRNETENWIRCWSIEFRNGGLD